MQPETIHKAFYSLSVHNNGLVEMTLKDNVNIDEAMAREVKQLLEELRPGCKFFILAEAEGFYMASKSFRKLMATEQFTSFIGACAICSFSHSLNNLHRAFNHMDVPVIPFKIFDKKDHALQWIRAFMM